jgi:hypothetical protein
MMLSDAKVTLSMECWWHDTDRKTEVGGEKPIPLSLCAPLILCGVAWD